MSQQPLYTWGPSQFDQQADMLRSPRLLEDQAGSACIDDIVDALIGPSLASSFPNHLTSPTIDTFASGATANNDDDNAFGMLLRTQEHRSFPTKSKTVSSLPRVHSRSKLVSRGGAGAPNTNSVLPTHRDALDSTGNHADLRSVGSGVSNNNSVTTGTTLNDEVVTADAIDAADELQQDQDQQALLPGPKRTRRRRKRRHQRSRKSQGSNNTQNSTNNTNNTNNADNGISGRATQPFHAMSSSSAARTGRTGGLGTFATSQTPTTRSLEARLQRQGQMQHMQQLQQMQQMQQRQDTRLAGDNAPDAGNIGFDAEPVENARVALDWSVANQATQETPASIKNVEIAANNSSHNLRALMSGALASVTSMGGMAPLGVMDVTPPAPDFTPPAPPIMHMERLGSQVSQSSFFTENTEGTGTVTLGMTNDDIPNDGDNSGNTAQSSVIETNAAVPVAGIAAAVGGIGVNPGIGRKRPKTSMKVMLPASREHSPHVVHHMDRERMNSFAPPLAVPALPHEHDHVGTGRQDVAFADGSSAGMGRDYRYPHTFTNRVPLMSPAKNHYEIGTPQSNAPYGWGSAVAAPAQTAPAPAMTPTPTSYHQSQPPHNLPSNSTLSPATMSPQRHHQHPSHAKHPHQMQSWQYVGTRSPSGSFSHAQHPHTPQTAHTPHTHNSLSHAQSHSHAHTHGIVVPTPSYSTYVVYTPKTPITPQSTTHPSHPSHPSHASHATHATHPSHQSHAPHTSQTSHAPQMRRGGGNVPRSIEIPGTQQYYDPVTGMNLYTMTPGRSGPLTTVNVPAPTTRREKLLLRHSRSTNENEFYPPYPRNGPISGQMGQMSQMAQASQISHAAPLSAIPSRGDVPGTPGNNPVACGRSRTTNGELPVAGINGTRTGSASFGANGVNGVNYALGGKEYDSYNYAIDPTGASGATGAATPGAPSARRNRSVGSQNYGFYSNNTMHGSPNGPHATRSKRMKQRGGRGRNLKKSQKDQKGLKMAGNGSNSCGPCGVPSGASGEMGPDGKSDELSSHRQSHESGWTTLECNSLMLDGKIDHKNGVNMDSSDMKNKRNGGMGPSTASNDGMGGMGGMNGMNGMNGTHGTFAPDSKEFKVQRLRKCENLKQLNSKAMLVNYELKWHENELISGPTVESKDGKLTIFDLIAHGLLYKLCKDQFGSRFIQTSIEFCRDSVKFDIYNQLKPCILELCHDFFGNYVVQKLFEQKSWYLQNGGNNKNKNSLGNDANVAAEIAVFDRFKEEYILEVLTGRVCELSCSLYGCRVVQRAIEYIDNMEVRLEMVSEMRRDIDRCITDQHANHVIQKVMQLIDFNEMRFVAERIKLSIYEHSVHPYACRVVQRLLEHCDLETKHAIWREVCKHSISLSKNQFGNYVVQHLLAHGEQQFKEVVLDQVCNNLLALSKHKFASNVVEKCIFYGSPQDKTKIVQSIVHPSGNNLNELRTKQMDGITVGPSASLAGSMLVAMVRDEYANYVVQRMLDLCLQERHVLIKALMDENEQLQKIPHGKHIYAKISKININQPVPDTPMNANPVQSHATHTTHISHGMRGATGNAGTNHYVAGRANGVGNKAFKEQKDGAESRRNEKVLATDAVVVEKKNESSERMQNGMKLNKHGKQGKQGRSAKNGKNNNNNQMGADKGQDRQKTEMKNGIIANGINANRADSKDNKDVQVPGKMELMEQKVRANEVDAINGVEAGMEANGELGSDENGNGKPKRRPPMKMSSQYDYLIARLRDKEKEKSDGAREDNDGKAMTNGMDLGDLSEMNGVEMNWHDANEGVHMNRNARSKVYYQNHKGYVYSKKK